MDKAIYIIIAIMIVLAGATAIVQTRATRKARKAVKLVLRWFDYIVAHPGNYDIVEVRRLGDEVDDYLASVDIGRKVMFVAPKLREYIIDRFGKNEGETIEEAFARLAHWESDSVKLEVYWTMIRGSFAEYIVLKEKGETPEFTIVSAPVAIVRRYWGV